MGKGDKKSARGKRAMGSYGVTRKRADNKKTVKAPVAVAATTGKEEAKKKPASRKKAE